MAQSGDNPFELKHRIDKTAVEKEPEETNTSKNISENPFNVVRLSDPNKPRSEKKKEESSIITPIIKKDGSLTDDKNFRFWIVMSTLILLAILSTLYRIQLTRAFKAFGNENVMRMLQREKGTVAYIPYHIWFGFFLLNGGFYIYLLSRYQGIAIADANWKIFFYTLGAVALVFGAKKMVISVMGYVFPIFKEAELYNMTITIFGIVMGIVLVVLNLFLAYSPENLLKIFVFASFIIIGGIYIFRALRGISISSKFLGFHKFHFFIYLCTVEIAPVVILWKMLTMNAGIQ